MPAVDVPETPLTLTALRIKREAKACDGNGGATSGNGAGTGTTRPPTNGTIDARGPPTLPPN